MGLYISELLFLEIPVKCAEKPPTSHKGNRMVCLQTYLLSTS